jgi:hypothetical protein
MRRLLVAMGAVAVIAPGAASAAVPIQPGMLIRTGPTQCTGGFVFDGVGAQTGHVYMGTAAHCVQTKGQAVLDADGKTIGKVAAFGAVANTQADDHKDWALFEVPASEFGRVDPALVGHPDLPHGGPADAAHVLVGDKVQFSGHGQTWMTPFLQQQRTGNVVAFAEPRYAVRGPIYFGDSGGPVVDLVSGRAVGVVSLTTIVGPGAAVATVYETSGPTPAAVVSQAAAAGVHVALRSVEGGKGALPPPPVVTKPPGARPKPKISFTIDYLLGRRVIRVGDHRLVVTAWLRGRKLELTLKRGAAVVSRAAKRVGSVRPDAQLVIRSARGRRSVRGTVRYGSKRVAFRATARRIWFRR